MDREQAIDVLADELELACPSFALDILPAAWLGRVVPLATFLL